MLAVSNSRLQLSSKAVLDAITFYNRVIADGGTVPDFSLVQADILELKRQCVYQDISLLTTATGRKAGKQYSILPTDGSGDLSVTRSGDTAMELNANGFWQPVAANLPRYDYVGGVPMINIEELRTNLLPRYKTFPDSDWTKSGARVEGDPSTAGAELVVNGGFDTDTAWVKGARTTISSGTANFSSAGVDSLYQNVGFTNGKMYYITIDVTSYTSGTLNINIGGLSIYFGSLTAIGSFEFFVYAQGSINGNIVFSSSNSFTGSIDNVSVKEVTGYASPFVDSAGVNLMDGYKLVAAANNGYIHLATAVTVTAATTYSNSVWIKRVTGTGQAYIIDTNTTDRAITLTTQWQRFEYSAAAGSTSGQIGVKLAVAGDEVLIAHAQLEAGATASSPIGGVEGSSQTRNADVIAKTGASALIGQTEGTVFVDFILYSGTSKTPLYVLTDDLNRIGFVIANDSKIVAQVRNNSISTGLVSSTFTYMSGQRYKCAFRYGINDVALCINGVIQGYDTDVASIPTTSVVSIGSVNNTLYFTNGIINAYGLIKTKLTDTQLQALTTL